MLAKMELNQNMIMNVGSVAKHTALQAIWPDINKLIGTLFQVYEFLHTRSVVGIKLKCKFYFLTARKAVRKV